MVNMYEEIKKAFDGDDKGAMTRYESGCRTPLTSTTVLVNLESRVIV